MCHPGYNFITSIFPIQRVKKNQRGLQRLLHSESSATGFQCESGHVYMVATPIGNLGDITLRALDTLRSADIILAEDTRHTIKLLNYFDIKPKELLSHHDHNYYERIPKIISSLKTGGRSVAVVTDAGTPCISDPGQHLVAACVKESIPIHPIPGPSALIAAISVAGFMETAFEFLGFVPASGSERSAILHKISQCRTMLIFYEAPHRIIKTFEDLLEHNQSNRSCVCCKELTKTHEQVYRGSVAETKSWLLAQTAIHSEGLVKGEFVVILGPQLPSQSLGADADSCKDLLLKLRNDGLRRSEAVTMVNEMFTEVQKSKNEKKSKGLSKNAIYKVALELDWPDPVVKK